MPRMPVSRREAVSMMIPNVYCVTSITCDEVLCEADGLDVVERMMPRVTKSTDAYINLSQRSVHQQCA